MAEHDVSRRRIKVRGGSLGPFLCWAVVFADIGTSVYYTPGILYGRFTTRSAIFVLMAMVVFVLLCLKYAEVTWRYPEGGGVVNVSSQALHPFAGLVGGLLILVDYFLTAGLSTLSGIIYLAVLEPGIRPFAIHLAVGALLGLGLLNAMGVQQSARTTAIFAVAAAGGQVAVVLATAAYLGPAGVIRSFHALTTGPSLSLSLLFRGYGAAFLAFSGLESIAQLAPSMRDPRRVVSYRAMGAVALTIALTSPLLTLWSTTLLGPGNDPNQFVSLLGDHVAGTLVGDYVAVSGAVLLVFAGNTAIIGSYHVFIALARMGFLPRALETRNHWRQTPHWAIAVAVAFPVAVVLAANGNVDRLGDLYAFGLLGTFVLTCLSLDVVRWRERVMWGRGHVAMFAVGLLTTGCVVVAWTVNLFAKPMATEFGGGLTLIGLVIGLATYRYSRGRRPAVFPVPFRPDRAKESIAHALGVAQPGADVLIILPHSQVLAEAVIAEGARVAAGRGVVFLYRGTRYPHQHHELLEVNDPWLKDYAAQAALARA
ncbi:MAG TPA: APC family permease, partial [Candidatus Udaeobacter sp.]|nr:APC family permease [Candidatus Udaeobacter sp.]